MLASLLAAPTLTFAFFGCNRVDAKDLDPVKNPSSANQAQLAQTLREVAAAKKVYDHKKAEAKKKRDVAVAAAHSGTTQ